MRWMVGLRAGHLFKEKAAFGPPFLYRRGRESQPHVTE